MIGKRSEQRDLFDVGNVYALELPAKSFYAQLAKAAPNLFSDDKFEALYSKRMGRPSVPPSALAMALILQGHDQVSDAEAIARTAFDLRWAAVLGREAGTPLCAKSTLQLFRAQLILNDGVRSLFVESIMEAKRKGLMKGVLRVAVDTKPILGRGAVEDTYNLLATGIRQLARAIARTNGQRTEEFLRERGFERFTADSVKGAADIDWSDEKARNSFLGAVVQDARKLLDLSTDASEDVERASDLLRQLLLQDIEEKPAPDGGTVISVKEGTAPGRVPSVNDPEMRHGRKSSSKRFDGHKASVAVDIESQIIVAADVLSGDAADQTDVLSLVKNAEANSGEAVAETLGDCAYGGGPTRVAFEEAGRTLIAKVPRECARDGFYPKSAFQIDLENNTVTCPAGNTTDRYDDEKDGSKTFRFGSVCASCPLKGACTRSARGRTLTVHPQEAQLRTARQYQATSEGKKKLRSRVAVEHALARLGHLGIGQARYRGKRKTAYQLLIAATIANLRRTWNWLEARNPSDSTPTGAPPHALRQLMAAISWILTTNWVATAVQIWRPHQRQILCQAVSKRTGFAGMLTFRPTF